MTFEHYRICEFDKYAVLSYNAVHGTNFETSDITKIHAEDLSVTDTDKYCYIMTYSFPCFPKGSLVLTDGGYKDISEIAPGDLVLCHDNRFHAVTRSIGTGSNHCLRFTGMGVDEIVATDNHLFYVREKRRVGHDGKRVFSEPKWKELREIHRGDYVGVAINQCAEIPKWDGIVLEWRDGRRPRKKNEISKYLHSVDFWWMMGRYLGDGWCKNGGIIISCPREETDFVSGRIKAMFPCTIAHERTADKIHISRKELKAFCEQFGKFAYGKEVPGFVINLPVNLLQGFVDGYISADGHENVDKTTATSASRKLIYGMAQCVAKVYKTPYSIYRQNTSESGIIEGRKVKQRTIWELMFKKEKKKQDKAFYENGFVWYPCNGVEDAGEFETYDISVDDAHSFTVQNTIVHNCQDLSCAGRQRGMAKGTGTRSGLLWEVERLLREMQERPQILLMENVPQVVSEKFIGDFSKWLEFLESIGYTSKYEILNAKDYGVPQNRERCFMVSWQGDYFYDFPPPAKTFASAKGHAGTGG